MARHTFRFGDAPSYVVAQDALRVASSRVVSGQAGAWTTAHVDDVRVDATKLLQAWALDCVRPALMRASVDLRARSALDAARDYVDGTLPAAAIYATLRFVADLDGRIFSMGRVESAAVSALRHAVDAAAAAQPGNILRGVVDAAHAAARAQITDPRKADTQWATVSRRQYRDLERRLLKAAKAVRDNMQINLEGLGGVGALLQAQHSYQFEGGAAKSDARAAFSVARSLRATVDGISFDARVAVLLWTADFTARALQQAKVTDVRSWAAVTAIRDFVAGRTNAVAVRAIADAAYAATPAAASSTSYAAAAYAAHYAAAACASSATDAYHAAYTCRSAAAHAVEVAVRVGRKHESAERKREERWQARALAKRLLAEKRRSENNMQINLEGLDGTAPSRMWDL